MAPNFQGRVEGFLNDLDIIRAVYVLHEVGHLTGAEPDHTRVIDERGRTITAERESASSTPGSLSCTQNIVSFSLYDIRSTLDRFGGCIPANIGIW